MKMYFIKFNIGFSVAIIVAICLNVCLGDCIFPKRPLLLSNTYSSTSKQFMLCDKHPTDEGKNRTCPPPATCENLWSGLYVCCNPPETKWPFFKLKSTPVTENDLSTGAQSTSGTPPTARSPKFKNATKKITFSIDGFQAKGGANKKVFTIHTNSTLFAKNETTSEHETTSKSSEPNSLTTVGTAEISTTAAANATYPYENSSSAVPATLQNTTVVTTFEPPNTTYTPTEITTSKNEFQSQKLPPLVHILQEGRVTQPNDGFIKFPSTITLIKDDGKNILVDTGLATDVKLLDLFLNDMNHTYGITNDDIDYVINTHGHPDHYGNDNLFPNSIHYFGGLLYMGEKFAKNELYTRDFLSLTSNVELHRTPGHTAEDISVVVKNVPERGTVAVVGDLFSFKEDVYQPEMWKMQSWNVTIQEASREYIACFANYIVPGHGPMFEVEDAVRHSVKHCSPNRRF